MFVRKAACVPGWGMTVDFARGLVVVSGHWNGANKYKLSVYSLADGSLTRTVGREGQFNWSAGGLCMTPRGTVLVAEYNNKRLQEVNIDSDDGAWLRFVGEGLLEAPDYVSCSESLIAVSETEKHRVVLLSWADGSLVARCDSKLIEPRGLRLLANGSGVVVADKGNDRVCIVSVVTTRCARCRV